MCSRVVCAHSYVTCDLYQDMSALSKSSHVHTPLSDHNVAAPRRLQPVLRHSKHPPLRREPRWAIHIQNIHNRPSTIANQPVNRIKANVPPKLTAFRCFEPSFSEHIHKPSTAHSTVLIVFAGKNSLAEEKIQASRFLRRICCTRF